MASCAKEAFAGRTVIVTGAGVSIGKPLSFDFAAAGANVVVNELGCDINGGGSDTSVAESIAAEIRSAGFSAVADTNSVTSPEKIIETALSHFGRVDVVVNNAGIIHHGPFEDQTPDVMRKIFETNALGAISLLHHAWPVFKKQGYGRVINLASDSVFGMPDAVSYVLSRSATLGITRTLALEGSSHNITVNAICPTSFSRMVADFLSNLPPQQYDAISQVYQGQTNVPLILALAHESNTISGEILSTGGYAIGRTILGTTSLIKDCKTMEEVQKALPQVLSRDLPWSEPKSLFECMQFRAESS
jgi:NAD(P)-dependent dehydrogenase (short-subunit alcohol dehydrogenase family)